MDSPNFPLVSIVCTTFNHEIYIRQTLNGFICQKTSFPFEIIVHDDASTDNTQKIVKEYEKKYPLLFRNIYRTENWYSQGKNIWEFLFTKVVRGKYIAICEGDDYWIDSSKLQKQVSFLVKHDDFILSFHRVCIIGKNSSSLSRTPPKQFLNQYDLAKTNYINTCSVVFRNICNDINLKFLMESKTSDYILWMLLSEFGRICYLPDVMSCYRFGSANSLWSSKSSIYQYWNWIKTLKVLITHFNQKTKYLLLRQLFFCYITLFCKYLVKICGGKR